ncbi:conserved hypothetical protein [Coccidioides posadasii str. Silveira]|uniref:Uncharacterized protein n=1 Tax=Coccidioides posadasii (strain RMSCC 757 / Silveira) TaxID=443226 RepID=E9D0Q7_COCPS|nr:conserved hypothetical protein [Coccidioides posadasii str. Silveira]
MVTRDPNLSQCSAPTLEILESNKPCRPPSTRPLNNARPNPSTEAWAWANHESYISATPMHRPSDFRPPQQHVLALLLLTFLLFFLPYSPLSLLCSRASILGLNQDRKSEEKCPRTKAHIALKALQELLIL